MDDRTVEPDKELVRGIPTEIFDEGNRNLVDRQFTVNFVRYVPPMLDGSEGCKRFITAVCAVLTDPSHPGLRKQLGVGQEV